MYTKEDICNMALSHIGGGKIVSLQDNNEKTRILNLHYEGTVKSVLRAFPWGFARTMCKPAQSTETIPGATYMYGYPPDCVNIRRIFTEGMGADSDYKLPYSIFTWEGVRYIGCEFEDIYMDYTAYVDIPDTYDPTFSEALSFKLAAVCSPSLTGNAQKSQEMLQMFQLTMDTAKHTAAVEGYKEVKYPSTYLDARGAINHSRYGRYRR